MRTTARSGQVFTKIVVPLVLFVVVIGGVAWVVQNLPSISTPDKPIGDLPPIQNMIKFPFDKSVWNADKPDYIAEFEPDQKGHYDFPFDNVFGKDIETSLEEASCTCTEVRVALIPTGATVKEDALTWTALRKAGEKNTGVDVLIPAGSKGIVRLGWTTRKDIGKTAYLGAKLWFQPKAMSQSRQYQMLMAAIRIVPPVRFLPETLPLASFREKTTGSFMCWSSTRDLHFKKDDIDRPISIDTRHVDPGFEYKITEIPDDKLGEFQKELDDNKIVSKAKSLVRIDVNVYEKRNEEYMDQGHFVALVPLLLKGEKYDLGPSLAGYVFSDIRISGFDDGKIQLGNFSGRDGKSPNPYMILADPKSTMLTLMRSPKTIDVTLGKVVDEGRRRWFLKVVVPPNTNDFPPADNVITLRSQPTKYYLANVAAMMGNVGTNFEFGVLPTVANLANVGAGIRQVHFPLLGQAVSR